MQKCTPKSKNILRYTFFIPWELIHNVNAVLRALPYSSLLSLDVFLRKHFVRLCYKLTVAFARYFLSEILRSFLTELTVAKQPKGKKNENELQMSGACPRKGEVIGEGNPRTSQL